MAKKPKPEPDNKEQSQRFVETAKVLKSNEDGKSFQRAFKKVVPARKTKPAEPRH